MRLWSPDSRAFAYPGMSEDGQEGIWIQSARPDRAPVLRRRGRLRGLVARLTPILAEPYAMSRRCIRTAPIATATSA